MVFGVDKVLDCVDIAVEDNSAVSDKEKLLMLFPEYEEVFGSTTSGYVDSVENRADATRGSDGSILPRRVQMTRTRRYNRIFFRRI